MRAKRSNFYFITAFALLKVLIMLMFASTVFFNQLVLSTFSVIATIIGFFLAGNTLNIVNPESKSGAATYVVEFSNQWQDYGLPISNTVADRSMCSFFCTEAHSSFSLGLITDHKFIKTVTAKIASATVAKRIVAIRSLCVALSDKNQKRGLIIRLLETIQFQSANIFKKGQRVRV